jgi:hypothetical protein
MVSGKGLFFIRFVDIGGIVDYDFKYIFLTIKE